MAQAANKPQILPVVPDATPQELKALKQWVAWKAKLKSDGKIGKVPIDPKNGRPVNALDPKNHLTFEGGMAAYEAGIADGVGFVLTGEPISHDVDGAPFYLVGVDLDNVSDNPERARELLAPLRGAYVETSPSGNGLRIFGLSRHKPRSGQGGGGELYAEGRFLTVTGQNAKGAIQDYTEAVKAVERMLLPASTPQNNVVQFRTELFDLNKELSGNEWLETGENIRRLEELLGWVPPDCSYEGWRGVIWAIASLDWSCGQTIVEEWSSGSAEHWDHDDGREVKRAISALFDSYDPDRGPSIGTLFHHAYENGMPRPIDTSSWVFGSEATSQSNFKLLTRADLDKLPPLRWIIQGVLPDTGLVTIFGEPSSGKTFLATNLAIKVSQGSAKWFGRNVVQRDVVLVALEGGGGIKQRVEAHEAVSGSQADKIQIVLDSLSLLSKEDVTNFASAVVSACEPGAVVIIDTFAQATAGADENSAKEMGLAVKAAQFIADAISGLVILIHHSGKDTSRGLRGHSVLNAAMDAVIAVERDRQTGRRTWRVTKMKDAEDGATAHFNLEVVKLGTDQFGDPITSCAVTELIGPSAAIAVLQPNPRGANQKAVYDALCADSDVDQGWTLDVLTDVAKGALHDIPSRHRATRAKDAIDGLIAGGTIKKSEGGVFSLTLPAPDHLSPSPYRGGRGGAVL